MDVEDTVFLLPGPVKMHPRVLRSMGMPAINHRSAAFQEVIAEVRELTKYLFQTSGRVAAAVEGGDFKAVTMCHNETSTGLTNPVKDVAGVVRKHGAMFIVDGITSVGGIDVRLEWGIDALVMGSQKCIAAPPGLPGVAVADRGY